MFATTRCFRRIDFYAFTDICDRMVTNQNDQNGERPSITRAQIKDQFENIVFIFLEIRLACRRFGLRRRSNYLGHRNTQSILKFEEHDKRCWTVEYCRCVDNMHLIAGSDDVR